MYTLVLMMALSGSADVPAACRGCRGCRGCFASYGCCGGYARYGCCGGGYACYGCCGGHHASHAGHGCCGSWVAPGMGPLPPPALTPKAGEAVPPPKETRGPAPATIFVRLPAAATLTIDDAPTTSTSAERVFVSPPLPVGKDFYYTLKAEMLRAGQTIVVSQRVAIRAGAESRVLLEFPVGAVTSVTQR